jgi:hypothetical protein
MLFAVLSQWIPAEVISATLVISYISQGQRDTDDIQNAHSSISLDQTYAYHIWWYQLLQYIENRSVPLRC